MNEGLVDLERHEGVINDRVFIFWVNYPFKKKKKTTDTHLLITFLEFTWPHNAWQNCCLYIKQSESKTEALVQICSPFQLKEYRWRSAKMSLSSCTDSNRSMVAGGLMFITSSGASPCCSSDLYHLRSFVVSLGTAFPRRTFDRWGTWTNFGNFLWEERLNECLWC